MKAIEVDSAITSVIENVSRPERALPTRPNLSHLPGDDSWIQGVRTVAGMIWDGQESQWRRAARHGPIARARIGAKKTVCVTDPALCAEALRNTDGAWSSGLGWRALMEGLWQGPGLITSDFDDHRTLRRLLQPAFTRGAVEGYARSATTYFESATDSWLDDGEVALKPTIRRLGALVSAKVFIGTDDPHEAEELDKDMAAFWGAMLSIVKHPLFSPALRKGNTRLRALEARLLAQVEERRRGDGIDLFTRVCKANDQTDWLDDAGKVSVFINVMAAAFDTTTAAITNMAYLLATKPEWQERLRREALAVGREPLDPSDLSKLEELEWFWKETLRYYPVAFAPPRVALRDVELGGFKIPAGTWVQFQIGMTFRDPSRWTDPDAFDPERFSPERAEDKAHRDAFLPFGAGAHACIGQQLSGLETKLFWHSLLRKARFRLAKPYRARHQLAPLGMVSGKVRLALEPI